MTNIDFLGTNNEEHKSILDSFAKDLATVFIVSQARVLADNAPEGAAVYEFEKGGHMMMEYDPVKAAEKTLPTIAKA